MNWLGDRYANGDLAAVDLDLAFNWYLRAAERGDRDAMFNLFCCYDLGNGTRADQQLALTLLRRAVDANHEQALCTLGRFYLDGVRVPHSASKGTELLEAARTLHGSVPAAAELSRRLQQGLGVPRDERRARELKRWMRSRRSRMNRWLLLGLTAGAGLIAIVLLARAVFVLGRLWNGPYAV